MSYSNANNIKLLVLDMDGVIFHRSNFYRDLQVAYNFDAEGYSFYQKELGAGKSYADAYQNWCSTFLTGKSADIYHQVINGRGYSIGLSELIEAISFRDIKTVIVTSGPYELAARAQRAINGYCGRDIISEIYANKIEIIDNKFTGRSEVLVDDLDKSAVIKELLEENKGHVACIGDGKPDIQIAMHSDIIIAYNSTSTELVQLADLSLKVGELGNAKKMFNFCKADLSLIS